MGKKEKENRGWEITEKELLEYLQERQAYLQKIMLWKKHESQIRQVKPISMQGSIRVNRHGNGYQYYLRTDPKDTSGKYLSRDQDEMIKEVLQKEYDEKIIQVVEKELRILDKYINQFSPTKLVDVYENLSEGRKRMLSPVVMADHVYVKKWMEVYYEGKPFLENTTQFITTKGERVRSKSEVIIANLLDKYQVPYRYEYPIVVKGLGKVYPDFTALNVRKRKEIYIEHLGMLDNVEYRENAIKKITKYELDGILLGDNLILTYETSKFPINIPLVEKKIQQLLF